MHYNYIFFLGDANMRACIKNLPPRNSKPNRPECTVRALRRTGKTPVSTRQLHTDPVISTISKASNRQLKLESGQIN
jgi:hypothetical protein